MLNQTNHFTTETEVKLAVPDAATFAALQNINQLGRFQIKASGSKTIVDRYLDTAGRRLFQAGYACRLRLTKQQQILAIKSLTPPQKNAHRRLEIEQPVDSDQPQQWPQGQAKNLVLKIINRHPLQTLFTLYQTRHKYQIISNGQPVIELSLDEVSLDNPATVDYFELEAELLGNGLEADLFEFVDALQSCWPLQPETQSKFERAYYRQFPSGGNKEEIKRYEPEQRRKNNFGESRRR